MGKLLQLFNAGRRLAAPFPGERPDHLRSEGVLAFAGWDSVTIPFHGFPVNPLANAHNAYAGLDPIRALRVLLGERDAACVCGHMESVVIVLLLRRLFRFAPKVVVWEVPWSSGWAFRERVARLALPRADACVVFDASQIALVRERYGSDVSVVAVPFYVDVDFFSPRHPGMEATLHAADLFPDLPGSGGEGYVYTVGRDAGRDFQIVVDAVAGTGVGLVVRSGRAIDVPVAARSSVVVMSENVDWDRYRRLYDGASVVIVASRETPNACGVTSLLEAMAMGKAVVVAGTAALSDYLPPPDAGVVVPVGDVDALRKAVLDLLADPERRERLGRRAREIVVERFSPDAHFARVASMLDSVVRRGSGPSFRAHHTGRAR